VLGTATADVTAKVTLAPIEGEGEQTGDGVGEGCGDREPLGGGGGVGAGVADCGAVRVRGGVGCGVRKVVHAGRPLSEYDAVAELDTQPESVRRVVDGSAAENQQPTITVGPAVEETNEPELSEKIE
jgi:hypothetical protein